eukprot:COSAG01_NODE_3018_length_6713_cov_20.002570_8_plen_46_part_00
MIWSWVASRWRAMGTMYEYTYMYVLLTVADSVFTQPFPAIFAEVA